MENVPKGVLSAKLQKKEMVRYCLILLSHKKVRLSEFFLLKSTFVKLKHLPE